MKTSYAFLISLLAVILMNSCSNDDQIVTGTDLIPTEAKFDCQMNGDCTTPEIEFEFINLSKQADNYYWDFGDGTFSVEANPKKVYDKAGEYDLTLFAIRNGDSVFVEDLIKVPRNSDGKGPSAEFAFTVDSKNSFQVSLLPIDASADYFFWKYGDGTFEENAIQGNRTHTFPGPGRYRVDLYVTNSEGTNCSSQLLELFP